MTDFSHLHNHTHYSLLDAACTPAQLIGKAKEYGHKSLALTDHGVMFGIMEFYKLAKKEGVKPILGFEAYVANGSRFDRTAGKSKTKKKNYFHLILLAKNETGYKNIIKLTSLAHTEGFYYKPRIDEELLKKYHEGVIATSACINGVINAYIVDGDYNAALQKARFYQEVFGDDFYIELQNHGLPEDKIIMRDAPKIASELGIKLVATNDIHYINKEDAVSHNVYLLIKDSSADSKPDIEQLRYKVPEMYYKSTEEMAEIFSDYPEALETTQEIADKCNVTFEKKYFLPDFPIPDDAESGTLDDYLRELTYKGLDERYEEINDEIKKRTEYELGVIIKMGFSGYFLIVQDFIAAARRMKVRVGPGRGSAAGSIVAYALGITNVDPLPYDLLFERFLNPERVSMPDIDIDFCDETREEIIKFVKEKYGEKSVAQIVTFGKLSSKAVLQDVGRVLGIHYSDISRITSFIPSIMGKVLPLEKALELPDLKWLKETKEPLYQKLILHSKRLEGLFRHTGTHAAGVVITPGDVVDYVPLYYSPSAKHLGVDIATQYSMKYLEEAGLLKMDFLGLKTLSIIDNILEMIKNNYGEEIDIDKVDLNDDATFKLFSEGRTLGVFQFESDGMRDYLMKLKPKNIEEITAMNALYRPGPMENIPDFIDRKFGRKEIEYLHPLMEQSLKKTYGIIVYQEQVMQLARDIGGFTLGQADILRRAMGKKDLKLMTEQKSIFSEGAQKNGIDKKTADAIFELINKFANYGFNKSHSLAYSFLAYQIAYLKTHYPAEFIAANMTAEMNDRPKIVLFMQEAESMGIKVMPPDVNNSTSKFTAKDNVIYFSLAAIKNVGIAAAAGIAEARKDSPFTSFFDFVTKVDTKFANRKILEALIYSGAFDSLNEGNRASLFASIDNALDFAKFTHSNNNMDSLFSGEEVEKTVTGPKLIIKEEWPVKEKFAKEKEFLDFYVSGHPMDRYKNLVSALSTLKLNDVNSSLIVEDNYGSGYDRFSKNKNSPKVRVCGIVEDLKTRLTKKNATVAFANMTDFKGKGELVFGSKSWEENKEKVKNNEISLCVGSAKHNKDAIKIIVQDFYDLYEAIDKFARGFEINIKLDKHTNSDIEEFSKLCTGISNKKEILFVISDETNNEKRKYISEEVNFPVNEYTVNKLIDIFGSENINLILSM
jgi:DNA polymerase-3 subunit alpha